MRCYPGPSCVLGPRECQFTVSQYYPPETEQTRIYPPFTPPPLPTTACGRGKVRPAGRLFPGAITRHCGGWTGTRGGVSKSSQERNGTFFPSSLLVRKTKGSRKPSRSNRPSTTWLSSRLGDELPVATALLQLVRTLAGLTPAWVLCVSAWVIAKTIRLIHPR